MADRLYLSELETVCQSSVVDAVAGFAACIHIVSALHSGPSCIYYLASYSQIIMWLNSFEVFDFIA